MQRLEKTQAAEARRMHGGGQSIALPVVAGQRGEHDLSDGADEGDVLLRTHWTRIIHSDLFSGHIEGDAADDDASAAGGPRAAHGTASACPVDIGTGAAPCAAPAMPGTRNDGTSLPYKACAVFVVIAAVISILFVFATRVIAPLVAAMERTQHVPLAQAKPIADVVCDSRAAATNPCRQCAFELRTCDSRLMTRVGTPRTSAIPSPGFRRTART